MNSELEKLSFHIKTGDYFPMIATLLGFVEETVQDCTCSITAEMVPIEINVLKNMREDLMYLHRNYRLVPISEASSDNYQTI